MAVVLGGALGCLNTDDDNNWECSGFDQSLIVIGAVGFFGFRIWEIVDVWVAPPSHNSKFNRLEKYINESKAPAQTKSSLDLVPVISPLMGQGLGLKYTF